MSSVVAPVNPNMGRKINVYDTWADSEEANLVSSGTFHGFSQDLIRVEDNLMTTTVAIVEDANGCIEVHPAQRCKFVNTH